VRGFPRLIRLCVCVRDVPAHLNCDNIYLRSLITREIHAHHVASSEAAGCNKKWQKQWDFGGQKDRNAGRYTYLLCMVRYRPRSTNAGLKYLSKVNMSTMIDTIYL
jgi:hypothetical protein